MRGTEGAALRFAVSNQATLVATSNLRARTRRAFPRKGTTCGAEGAASGSRCRATDYFGCYEQLADRAAPCLPQEGRDAWDRRSGLRSWCLTDSCFGCYEQPAGRDAPWLPPVGRDAWNRRSGLRLAVSNSWLLWLLRATCETGDTAGRLDDETGPRRRPAGLPPATDPQ